jgi:hypothetical protein
MIFPLFDVGHLGGHRLGDDGLHLHRSAVRHHHDRRCARRAVGHGRRRVDLRAAFAADASSGEDAEHQSD